MAKSEPNRHVTGKEVLIRISDATGLSRKQVAAVFEALSDQIAKSVGKKGSASFVVPGLMKITVVTKPATKARKGINPFTKEEMIFKARPARKVVKIRPLKALKEMALAGSSSTSSRTPRYQCDANGEYTSLPYCDEHQSPCHPVP